MSNKENRHVKIQRETTNIDSRGHQKAQIDEVIRLHEKFLESSANRVTAISRGRKAGWNLRQKKEEELKKTNLMVKHRQEVLMVEKERAKFVSGLIPPPKKLLEHPKKLNSPVLVYDADQMKGACYLPSVDLVLKETKEFDSREVASVTNQLENEARFLKEQNREEIILREQERFNKALRKQRLLNQQPDVLEELNQAQMMERRLKAVQIPPIPICITSDATEVNCSKEKKMEEAVIKVFREEGETLPIHESPFISTRRRKLTISDESTPVEMFCPLVSSPDHLLNGVRVILPVSNQVLLSSGHQETSEKIIGPSISSPVTSGMPLNHPKPKDFPKSSETAPVNSDKFLSHFQALENASTTSEKTPDPVKVTQTVSKGIRLTDYLKKVVEKYLPTPENSPKSQNDFKPAESTPKTIGTQPTKRRFFKSISSSSEIDPIEGEKSSLKRYLSDPTLDRLKTSSDPASLDSLSLEAPNTPTDNGGSFASTPSSVSIKIGDSSNESSSSKRTGESPVPKMTTSSYLFERSPSPGCSSSSSSNEGDFKIPNYVQHRLMREQQPINSLEELRELLSALVAPGEEIEDFIRLKPPVSYPKWVDRDLVPHELSTIVEVDSPQVSFQQATKEGTSRLEVLVETEQENCSKSDVSENSNRCQSVPKWADILKQDHKSPKSSSSSGCLVPFRPDEVDLQSTPIKAKTWQGGQPKASRDQNAKPWIAEEAKPWPENEAKPLRLQEEEEMLDEINLTLVGDEFTLEERDSEVSSFVTLRSKTNRALLKALESLSPSSTPTLYTPTPKGSPAVGTMSKISESLDSFLRHELSAQLESDSSIFIN